MNKVRCAVFLSGSGRTLQNFFQKIDSGELPVEIVAVVSSRKKVRGVQIGKKRQIPVEIFPRREFANIEQHNGAISQWLEKYNPQIIVLAGYLCFFQQPEWFSGPVVNIHPALLPKFGGKGFYGHKVHQAVLEAGEKESGCTVHLVDDQYDTGRILAQQAVPVLPDDCPDSLASRVFEAESQLYPKVLKELAEGLLE
ncbi:MAG: phosphoribosylglycinamide formyltransferase [bacterium]|nr:phosphoribosylglycinamide formyltransferase [bacterium]